jgi:hypothetical protein
LQELQCDRSERIGSDAFSLTGLWFGLAACDKARRSVFGLTPQQVLERFGAPTSVEATNEHTRLWVWSVEERFDFCVVFVDGFATSID